MDQRARYLFYSKLAALLEGVPLERALEMLGQRAGRPREKAALQRLRQKIREGSPLSAALAADPENFPALDAEIVRQAEGKNTLAPTLTLLGRDLEKAYHLRLKHRPQRIYIEILIGLGLALIIALSLFIAPVFMHMFEDMNIPGGLPRLTIFYLDLYRWFVLGFGWILALIALAIYFYLRFFSRGFWHRLLYHLPWLSRREVLIDGLRFSQAMAAGLDAGVALPQCLALAAATVRNQSLHAALAALEKPATEGGRLSELLARVRGLPGIIADLQALGADHSPAAAFQEAAVFMERGVETTFNLIAIPIFIMIYGLLVLQIMSCYLPIFQMMGGGAEL